MTRPDGTPFWGESLPAWDWYTTSPDVDTNPPGWNLRLGLGYASPPVLLAGQSISAICYETRYLQAGDAADISWVVTLGPGSAGTVRVSSGLNPSWDETTGTLTEDLGSHVITGATELVLPTSSITVADVLAQVAGPQCLLECLTGSVVLHQIRLRVWPPGGPLGGWSGVDLPSREETGFYKPYPFYVHTTTDTIGHGEGTLDDAGHEAAWYAAVDDLQARIDAAPPPYVALSGYGPGGAESGTLLESTAKTVAYVSSGGDGASAIAAAGYGITGTWLYRFPGQQIVDFYRARTDGLVEGLDYIVPPDMVDTYRDDGIVEWVNAALQVRYSPGLSGVGLHGTSALVASSATPIDALTIHRETYPWTYSLDIALPTSGVSVSASDPDTFAVVGVDLPLDTSGDAIAVIIRHSIETDDPTYLGYGSVLFGPITWADEYTATPGVGDLAGPSFQRLNVLITVPPAQLWVPATVSSRAQPLQWSQRDDGLGMSSTPRWKASMARSTGRWRGQV